MKLTPVLQGQPIPVPSLETDGNRGGFTRKPAPTNGYAWEAGEACGFVSKTDLQRAVVELRMLERQGPTPRVKFVGRGVVP